MTNQNLSESNCMLIDLKGLMKMLSCGRVAAERVGKDSAAIVRVGRRKLYNVEKVRIYIDAAAGGDESWVLGT